MNTKLLFYCTHFQYGTFEKIIFETVLEESFECNNDAKNWLDDQIPSLCDEFDLSLVFDWIVVGYESTDIEVSDTKIFKTQSGDLVFDEPKKQRKPRTTKVKVAKTDVAKTGVKITTPVKEIPKVKREYQSVWIDPYGKTYAVRFAGHNDFAAHWLKENDEATYNDVRSSHSYYYEELEEKGWARILGWTDPPTFVLPETIGVKLKNSIREYCLSQKLSYLDFPEMLKS